MFGNKILIIGCAGSGKTTLAKKISKCTEIPIIHMDKFYWKDNWEKVTDIEWEAKVSSLCQVESWVMDGNYTSTLSMRMKYATTVIYLDMPRWKCLLRVFTRRFKFIHNQTRQDLPENCHERVNLKFYKWVWNYPKRSRQITLDMLSNFNGLAIILKTRREIKQLVSRLSEQS